MGPTLFSRKIRGRAAISYSGWPKVCHINAGGAEGAAAAPTFGTGEQAIVLALPKVGE